MKEPSVLLDAGVTVAYSKATAKHLERRAAGRIDRTHGVNDHFDPAFRQWWAQQCLQSRNT